MGLTQKLGTIPLAIFTDTSNNVGIGGSPSGSYKFDVTGTGRFTGDLSVTSTYGFTIGAVSGAARIQYGSSAANSFTFLTSGNGFANLYAGAATFSGQIDGSIINSTSNLIRLSGNTAVSLTTINSQTLIKINAAGYWGTQIVGSNDQGIIINSSGNVHAGGTTNSTVRLGTFGNSQTSAGYSFVAWDSGGADLLSVRNDGLVTFPKTVSGWTTGNGANTWLNPASGDIYRSTSSLKYKKNVQDYNKGLAEVLQLRPVSYEGKHEVDEGKTFAGLIAEEVHELGLTEFVQYAEDGSPDALAYQNMVSLLVKAIQELSAKVSALENKS
jgi:hypothetical protein